VELESLIKKSENKIENRISEGLDNLKNNIFYVLFEEYRKSSSNENNEFATSINSEFDDLRDKM